VPRYRAASLGHGLPLAVGTALGLRAMGLTEDRVFVLTGDGELDEGSGHEAIAFAGRAGIESLHCVVVDNSSASYGWPGGIETRFAAEGWSTTRGRRPRSRGARGACSPPPIPASTARRRRGHRARLKEDLSWTPCVTASRASPPGCSTLTRGSP
jgi:transketolase